MTPNFDDWFSMRHREVMLKLKLLHLEVLCATDLTPFLPTRQSPTDAQTSTISEAAVDSDDNDHDDILSDVQLVDLIMKICDKMVRFEVFS